MKLGRIRSVLQLRRQCSLATGRAVFHREEEIFRIKENVIKSNVTFKTGSSFAYELD
jgi:hypothetical protein